jgi:hypothetical protein
VLHEISGEHYISHSLIKLYTFNDPDVRVKRNSGFGIRHDVRPKNFVVNALCTNRNSALGVTDKAALEFATFVRSIAIGFRGGAGEWGAPDAITISGDDLERWALKLLMNHAAGKAFSANQGQVSSPIPPVAVDFLLGRTTWPFGMGLCVAGDPANSDLPYDAFTYADHSTTDFWGAKPLLKQKDQTLGGGIIELNGFGFGLSLFPIFRGYTEANGVKHPFRGALERPDYIEWNLDGIGKRVNFTWSGPTDHKYIVYTMYTKTKVSGPTIAWSRDVGVPGYEVPGLVERQERLVVSRRHRFAPSPDDEHGGGSRVFEVFWAFNERDVEARPPSHVLQFSCLPNQLCAVFV